MTGRHTAGLIVVAGGHRMPSACNTALAWAVVQENSHTSATAEVGIRDPHNASLLAEWGITLGGALKLVSVTADGEHPLFEGEVTDCEARASSDGSGSHGFGGVLTVIRARDCSHRLRRGYRVASYPKMTAGDIVRKVANEAGVQTGTVDDASSTYDFLTQPAMSDWDFLSHLARENGRDLFFRDGKLHFCQPAPASSAPAKGTSAQDSPFALQFGANLLKVGSVASLDDQVTGVAVRGWDPERKEPFVATGNPVTARHSTAWTAPSGAVSGPPLLLAGLPRGTQGEAETLATSMAQEVAAGLPRLRAVVRGEPRLRLRSGVSLTGLGKQFEGQYTVTSVRHEYHPDSGYLTELTVNEGADRTAVGRPGDGEVGLRRFYGLMPAKVVNIKDDKDQGRVKVQLPWLDAQYESNWARTVQLSGSRGHGVVVPEVGDEVLVGFEHGSLDRPYVLGGLYNGVDKLAPHELDLVDGGQGKTNRRSFASKEGHRLELLDAGSPGMGATLITGDGKLQIQLDQHNTLISVQSNGTVEITAEHGIAVDAGNAPLELKGQSIDINAQQSLKISGTQVEMSGTKVDVSAATAKFSGSTVAEISGALVKIN
ncbi:VgrG-related protein (plasmid) [Streptomyces sp. QH1-20]|uniref:VgrG-related protein n=1 Tax=Streptomyces sp. QH1-20 TaxID=3240934 RepID=UPI00351859D8